jgi:hypothetical protein
MAGANSTALDAEAQAKPADCLCELGPERGKPLFQFHGDNPSPAPGFISARHPCLEFWLYRSRMQ